MYSGTQHSDQCYCDNSYGTYGSASNCNEKCAGNDDQICGGSWALSVYDAGKCTFHPFKSCMDINLEFIQPNFSRILTYWRIGKCK